MKADTKIAKKVCFLVCPIGEPGSPERKHSDLALKHVFSRALEPMDYEVIRADKISEPGIISLQIINRLLSADLVVADMTGRNAVAFSNIVHRLVVTLDAMLAVSKSAEKELLDRFREHNPRPRTLSTKDPARRQRQLISMLARARIPRPSATTRLDALHSN